MKVHLLIGISCDDCGADLDVRVLDHEPTREECVQFGKDGWSSCRRLMRIGPLELNGPLVTNQRDGEFYPPQSSPEGTGS